MSKADIGVSIGIDGEAEYRQALRNINSETKELKSEIKLWTATYEENANTVEALTDKHSILSRQLESQSKKVETYQSAVDSANKAQEQSKEKVSRLSDSLEEAKAKLEELKNSTNKSEDAIKEQEATIKNLSSTLSLAEKELEKNSNAAINYKTSLNYANAEMSQTQQELKKTEQHLKEAENSTDKCATSIDRYGDKVKIAGEQSELAGNKMNHHLTGAAMIASFTALAAVMGKVAEQASELGKAAASYADDMLTMSIQTGISTDSLQALNYMSGLTDTSMETITKTMAKNIKSMDSAREGTEAYTKAYETLGISVAYSDGSLKNSEVVYWEAIDSLGKMKNETEANAIAMQLFGKSAQDLNPLIAVGTTGVQKFTQEAKDMGAILNQDTLSSLGGTADALDRMSQAVDIAKRKIGVELAPEIEDAAESITERLLDMDEGLTDFLKGSFKGAVDGLEWLLDHSTEVATGLSTIGTSMLTMKAANVIQDIVQGYRAYKAVTEGATIAQYALNTAQAANPIGLIVTGLAAATTALVTYTLLSEKELTNSQKMLESHREQIEAFKESSIEREKSVQKMAAEETTILNLKNQLIELTQKEKLSIVEKTKLSEIVEKLNSALPEMNLSINEQTGLLEQNVEELEKLIDANLDYLKVEAAKEDLSDIAREQYEAEVQLSELLKEKATAVKNLEKAEREYQDTLRDNTAHTMKGSVAVSESYQKYADAKNIVGGYQVSIEELDGIIQNSSAEFERNTEYINKNSQSLKDGQTVQIEYKDTVISASGEVGEAIQATKLAYDESKQAAQDSLNEQVGLFEKLSSESELNVAEIAENLKSQTETFNLYKDNILIAEQLVEKGLLDDGLLGSIKELGLEGAGYLNELVEASKTSTKDLEEVMNNWAEMQDAKDQLSSTMADVETNYTSTMDDILAQSERTNRMLSEMTEDGFMQMNQTVLTFTPMLGQSTKFMGDNMVGAFEKSMEIANDRSEKMFVFGKTITDSLSEGILNGTGTVSAAIAKMIQDSVNNADVSGLVDSIDKGLGKRMNY